MNTLAARNRGFTLIETIIAIVVIAASVTAVLGLLSSISLRSAEAALRTQSLAVAAAYLEEVLSKAYADPGGGPEAGRQDFDDVRDYHSNAFSPVADQWGAAVAGLNGYAVRVRVFDNVALGAAPNAAVGRRIEVTVRSPAGAAVVLNGYRFPYASNVAYEDLGP